MNVKYKKYIDYIVSDIEKPYFINMRDHYGLKDNEMNMVLSKVFNQPVKIKDNDVYDINDKIIYYENSDGDWFKKEYDTNGKVIYFENSSGSGFWYKYKYNTNGNKIYSENSNGDWVKYKYDINGNLIYREDSDGVIIDNR